MGADFSPNSTAEEEKIMDLMRIADLLNDACRKNLVNWEEVYQPVLEEDSEEKS